MKESTAASTPAPWIPCTTNDAATQMTATAKMKLRPSSRLRGSKCFMTEKPRCREGQGAPDITIEARGGEKVRRRAPSDSSLA